MGEDGLLQPVEIWPAEPLTFVGWEREWQPGLRGEDGRWVIVERWIGSLATKGSLAQRFRRADEEPLAQ